MAGKGDDRRPSAVTDEEFEAAWRRIFGSTERLTTAAPAQEPGR